MSKSAESPDVALVTGASSGIGRATAAALAKAGYRLVLVARSTDRLEALAAELEPLGPARPTVVAMDLSGSRAGETLRGELDRRGITVDVLVNNAGFGTYGRFGQVPLDQELGQVALNIGAVLQVTHALLPRMLERRHGAVVNIASAAAFQPDPYMAVYGATKAFVLNFTEALWAENAGSGVHIAAICPGAVETAFISNLESTGIRSTSTFSRPMPVERVAAAVLNALRTNQPTHIVGGKNRLLATAVRFIPRASVARTSERMLRPRTETVAQA
jgi:short-subunit dehydrogenase